MTTARPTLETTLTHARAGFGLDASALQRAVMRAADGLPLDGVLDDAAIDRHFGCASFGAASAMLGHERPDIVEIVAGVRGGKSLMLGAACLHAAMHADLSQLRRHEVSRAAIVGPSVDNAQATFRLMLGAVQSSPLLSKLVVGEPTADTFVIRRADGRLVEIVVVAGHRGGMTLRSRWLVFLGLEEVALFGSESAGATVNAEELLRAGETRLVRGGQAWIVSSPFGPTGLLYDLWKEHFGKPGRVLVVHAPTRALNPSFPDAKIEAVRRRDPDAAAREYDAQWVDAEVAYLEAPVIDGAARSTPDEEPRIARAGYVAAHDAGGRSNAWAVIVLRVTPGDPPRYAVAVARQWVGTKQAPLNPDLVLAEEAALLARYGVSDVPCDRWAFDANRSLAERHGLRLLERGPAEAQAGYGHLRSLLATSALELAPSAALLGDLKGLRRKAAAGSIRVEPSRTADGRHGDFAPALALALHEASARGFTREPTPAIVIVSPRAIAARGTWRR